MSVVDKIHHYQRNIEKCNDDEERILHCISKLYKLPVTVQHLQETGVGRTVNALRKYDGDVGNAAKALVAKWKAMVADEETSDGEDEDEACVPDAPESYSDSRESPKPEEHINTNTTDHSRHKNEESKHLNRHKTEKTEISSTQNNKHISKQEVKSKSSENESRTDSESSKNEMEKHRKQEKSRHSHKHESKTERKSFSKDSKSSKSSSKKDERHSTKDHTRKSESLEKVSGKSASTDKLNRTSLTVEESKKRKIDSSVIKKESKRRKNSECESDEDKTQTLSDFEKYNPELKIKQEPKDKDSAKNEVKHEKKISQDKLKNSSSKSKSSSSSSSSSSKSKDDEEKKHKKDLKKSEVKKDSSHHSSKESSESKSHHSSSSSKNHYKSKDRSKRKEEEDGKHKNKGSERGELKDKHSCKESKEVTRIKQEINGDEGIDCNSGASFAEALGMCTITQPSRKRSNNSPNLGPAKSVKTEPSSSTALNNKKASTVKTEPTCNESPHPPSLLSPNVKLEPLSVDLAATLPEISPNYKPLPYINPIHRKEEDKALTDVIYAKNQRTKVYSGNKCGYTSVPSLYELCIRVLIENIDALEFTGGVPYDIMKPVLERATPDQLFMLEHYNPYLIEDTDSLWQFHCSREFRNKQREEMETWREMYMRCLDEREAKLKTLTANIKQSIDKSVPVRSTKLAYVDNVVKPPRNILKKQAKYGTAGAVPTSASNLKKKLISGGGPAAATNIAVPPPPMSRAKIPTGVVKKTKAPLMAKALQLIKGRYKR